IDSGESIDRALARYFRDILAGCSMARVNVVPQQRRYKLMELLTLLPTQQACRMSIPQVSMLFVLTKNTSPIPTLWSGLSIQHLCLQHRNHLALSAVLSDLPNPLTQLRKASKAPIGCSATEHCLNNPASIKQSPRTPFNTSKCTILAS
ncbi:hypothetical protein KC19_7G150000, partial [Ceratodon purpureus]